MSGPTFQRCENMTALMHTCLSCATTEENDICGEQSYHHLNRVNRFWIWTHFKSYHNNNYDDDYY